MSLIVLPLSTDQAPALSRGRVYAVSLVSSPGTGKTTFLEKLLGQLRSHFRVAAVVGDIYTDNDA
jgi:Ni2+-binding GTPase involved in maturation of urease and hydrogenase